ncbi:MAG: LuxR C-terminal-related transcriptional regulator [Cyanobacteria bacterium J06632_19]
MVVGKYQNIVDLSSVCIYISASIAALQARQTSQTIFSSTLSVCLTSREIQIAELVAKGLTNKQIDVQLWITQNSVKQTSFEADIPEIRSILAYRNGSNKAGRESTPLSILLG